MITTLMLPEQRVHAEMLPLRIGSLHAERPDYDNYPSYQRERVWTYAMKRSLIDTILRGLPMPPLFVIRRDHKFWVDDGQQRLTTILEFRADGFATARLREDPALSVIEPNKRYSQLSTEWQDAFNDYALQIWVINERDEANLGVLFRRLQQQQPLSLGERLWTYRNEARQQVRPLMDHPFWKEIYIGKLTRKRTFLGSLYLHLMELDQMYSSITTPRLRDIAAGSRDGALNPRVIQASLNHLGDVLHLFAGSMIASMRDLIPLYQAILLLEKAEYDLKKSEKGCLTPWYQLIKEDSFQARRTPGTIDLLAKITTSKHQVEFWKQESDRMMASKGLYQVNKKRTFSASDRQEAWERQQGMCPVCLKPVKPTDEGHHIIQYQKGGPTTPENCMIVHTECHLRLHDIKGIGLDTVPVEESHL